MASQQLQNIGLALQGFGAGLQGNLPQFQAVQQQTKMQDAQLQMQQQEQKMAMQAERQKTLFMDAAAGLALLDQENYDGLVRLGMNRLQLLQQFPDANPEDTQRLTKLAVAAKNGSDEAKQLLRDELESTVQIGQAIGVLKAPASGESFTLSPGEVRFGPDGQPLASVAAAEDPINYNQPFLPDGSPNTAYQQYQQSLKQTDAPEQDVYGEAGKLRTEFLNNPQVKDFGQQSAAYGRIQAAAADPSAAGDMALIFGYMKLLDPTSTVREGEYATVANSGNVSEQVMSAYNKAVEGTKLADTVRSDFVNRASRLYRSAEQDYSKVFDRYKGIAERRGLPIEDALVDYRSPQDDTLNDAERAELEQLRAKYGR